MENVDTVAASSLRKEIIPPEFAAIGIQRLEQLGAMQVEFLNTLQELNRSWLERMQSEAALASECANKLTMARSFPEAAAVYQEWATRRIEMATEDAQHLLADGQIFAATGARLLSDGGLPDGHAGGT